MATGSAIHISRERFHLAWDPAIPAIETVQSGDEVEFDLLDAGGGQLTATSTVADIATLDFSRVDQVNGPVAVEGRGARRHAPGRPARVPAGRLGLDRDRSRASGCSPTTSRSPRCAITRVPASAAASSSCPASGSRSSPFCGEVGVAPRTGPLSTIPPDVHGGNMDTRHLSRRARRCSCRCSTTARGSVAGRRPRGPGRRRGVRDRDRDADARARPADRAQGPVHSPAPEFITAPDPRPRRPSGRGTRRTASGRTCTVAARDAVRRMIDWLGREHGLAADRRLHAVLARAWTCGSARSWTCRTSSSRRTARWASSTELGEGGPAGPPSIAR